MQHDLLSEMLEALFVIRGLIVQKTKLISDCNRLLKELLDGLLVESTENKWKFIRACISGLQSHRKESKHRTTLVINCLLCVPILFVHFMFILFLWKRAVLWLEMVMNTSINY